MTHLKLSLTTIVVTCLVAMLSLIALISRPALSLETGYRYGTNENPSTADRYRDLKCTYLFAALTHMRLLKLMLEDKTVAPGVPAGIAVLYNSRAVICTLYDVADVEIGSLWLVHLYVSMVQNYHDTYIGSNPSEDGRPAAVAKLADVTGYVASKVQWELSDAGCRPRNRFDTYERWHAETAAATTSGTPNFLLHIKPEAISNRRELDKLLAANNAKTTYGTRYEALRTKPLLLNNMGLNKQLKSTLLYTFDVQVTWHGTFTLLEESWLYMHKNMFSKNSGLSNIKKYYITHFSLLTGIVYRLTWKCLLHVKTLTSRRRVGYLNKWHDLLADFQKLFRLQDDPDVAGLLVAIDRLGRNDESIVNIIYQLQDKLCTINKYLQCKATDPMNLEAEEFPSSTSVQAAIERKSLDEARDLLAFLKSAFKPVDFDLVRSLVKYVDYQSK